MEKYFNLETLVMAIAWLGSFAAIMTITLPLLKKDYKSSRLHSIAMRREELSRQQKERINNKGARYQTSSRVSLMKKILEKLKLQNKIASTELRDRLQQAGWRGQSSMIVVVFARLTLPIGAIMFVTLVLSSSNADGMSFTLKVAISLVAAGIAYSLPGVLITNAVQNRQQILRRSFPDAVDLLLICVEAGLSVEAAFARVTEEMAEGNPIIAEEIGLTSAELSFLPERRVAYENLSKRTGLDTAKQLGMTLIQSEKYGTPVAVALRTVSQESRDSRMAIAEKKAGSLPAKLTVPMIAFFLPVLFVVILGPAIIQVISQLM
ncbi:MAG: type II secretion system F family protein [Alphaproteobacteria bacterium]|nr:type II secretion system F family protein [Alphaproteobacteria bacterium]